MRYMHFLTLLSLLVLAFASLYYKRSTDFAIFYTGAMLFIQIGRKS